MSGFMGKDGFAWFFGVVEDRMDPLESGRVKVRIFGFHSENKETMPTSSLPWATLIQPVTSSAFSGKGFSSVGLLEGTWVFGFFADPGSYQVPVIIGGLSGLNAQTIKELNENYGNAFKDMRSNETLSNYPIDKLTRSYPDGKSKDGDRHGAQLKNEKQSRNYPRKEYSAKASGRKQGTPDFNILAINDSKRLENTIVDLKTKTREDGGLRDTNIPVANIFFPKFVTGVIGLSGANLGTNKGLGIPPNYVSSSSTSSMKNTYSQFKSTPKDSNMETIHTNTSPLNTLKETSISQIIPYNDLMKTGIGNMNSVITSMLGLGI
jgi:hypothetical protein